MRRPFARLSIVYALLLHATGCMAADAAPTPWPRLGTNVAGPCDWNTELPLRDVMRFSRAWSPQATGLGFGQGPPILIAPDGYPAEIPDGAWAESPLISFEGHPWPAGEYLVTYSGSGRIAFNAPAVSTRTIEPGKSAVTMDPSKGNLHVSILATDPEDPVRSLSVLMPGGGAEPSDPWTPWFLDRWQGVACFRFMDFMATNNSRIRTWDERPRVGDATYAGRGVPLELLIDLCNLQKTDPWFCIPHLADDDYIRRFAELVRDQLSPSLRVHVEYSNEVWNPGFQQHRYASEEGQKRGLSTDPAVAVWRFTAMRSLEVFAIFEQVFGGTERLVRILPAQAGNVFMAREILNFRDAAKHADAIAVAPYVGINVLPEPDRHHPLGLADVADWDTDQLFHHLTRISLPPVLDGISRFRELANQHHLDLVAYEGGQHLTGLRGAENDPSLNALFFAANEDSRMEDLYRSLLDGWTERGGSLFCHFSSVARWTKWGSWGTLQFYNDPAAASPKWRALASWAQRIGQDFGSVTEQVAEVPVGKNINPEGGLQEVGNHQQK